MSQIEILPLKISLESPGLAQHSKHQTPIFEHGVLHFSPRTQSRESAGQIVDPLNYHLYPFRSKSTIYMVAVFWTSICYNVLDPVIHHSYYLHGFSKPSKTEPVSKSEYFHHFGPLQGAVANMIQKLGLREAAGPFDWIRSNGQGVTHLLRNGFQEGSEKQLGWSRKPVPWVV